MVNIFALTTRGLETISAEEMGALPGVTVGQVAYRRVNGTCDTSLVSLLELRTVDDVFLDVATWSGVDRPRSALARLSDLSAQLDLREAAARCAEVRPMPPSPAFSVTANFVGKRNYSAAEIKQACAESIAVSHSWTYTPDDAIADLNVRVFIEHDAACVGVRLGKLPLHRRPYKQVHLPGSLKPPVAAAMLRLAGVDGTVPGLRVLDPCCGVGTILIEATAYGAVAQGGDSDPAAIAAARANAGAADVVIDVRPWDAQALPLPGASVDRVVSNLPWGHEVSVDADLVSFYRRVCAEARRVVAPGGKIALLTGLSHLVVFDDLQCERQLEISLFGQRPILMLFSA